MLLSFKETKPKQYDIIIDFAKMQANQWFAKHPTRKIIRMRIYEDGMDTALVRRDRLEQDLYKAVYFPHPSR